MQAVTTVQNISSSHLKLYKRFSKRHKNLFSINIFNFRSELYTQKIALLKIFISLRAVNTTVKLYFIHLLVYDKELWKMPDGK